MSGIEQDQAQVVAEIQGGEGPLGVEAVVDREEERAFLAGLAVASARPRGCR